MSAGLARERFGFQQAVSDADEVLQDPEIMAVFVLTPHGTHAALTARALAAGKAVYVEKPLAFDRQQLAQVVEARQGSSGFLQVGFNRRFAPCTTQVAAQLEALKGRCQIFIRVNVGAAGAGTTGTGAWEADQEQGGGRLLGEACHFVDLAQHLAGAPFAAVQAASVQVGRCPAEDFGAQLEFADGSLATIAYTTFGDAAYSKESVEVFCAGQVFRIEDFRSLTTVRDGKTRRSRGSQDKGHPAALAAFAAAAREGGPPPIAEEALLGSSLAVIALKESLLQGDRVRLA